MGRRRTSCSYSLQRLRECVDTKQYTAAVRIYTVGNAILQKYKHMKSFQHIQEESDKVWLLLGFGLLFIA